MRWAGGKCPPNTCQKQRKKLPINFGWEGVGWVAQWLQGARPNRGGSVDVWP